MYVLLSNQIYTGPVLSASILIHLSLNEDLWGWDNNEGCSDELFVWKPSNRLTSWPTIYQVSPELHPWSGELDRMPLRSGFLSSPEGNGRCRSRRNWSHTGGHKPSMAYTTNQNSHGGNHNCSHNNMPRTQLHLVLSHNLFWSNSIFIKIFLSYSNIYNITESY